MFSEYYFLKKQSQQLIELQEDYRNYISILRKEFESQKSENQEVESLIDEKKKPFLIINREKEYLKKSFLDFLKKKNVQHLFKTSKFYKNDLLQTNVDNKNKTKILRNRNNQISFKKNALNKNSKKLFIWPINTDEFWISSFFGLRKLRKKYSFHYGIDMAALKGTAVYAAAAGAVTEAKYSQGYGNTIVIKHDQKYKTRYAHLNTINVKFNQQVEKGEKIGTVGDSGSVRSSGKNRDPSHLHFEVHAFGKQVNPLYVLQ